MDALFRDLRFAARTLAKKRSFTLLAVLTLALGIGGTTAVFSVLNAVVLSPLPYPEAHELVRVRTAMTDGRLTGGQLSPFAINRLNEHGTTLEWTAGAYRFEVAVQDMESRPLKTMAYVVTEGFFDVFGKSMALGRGFVPEEHPQMDTGTEYEPTAMVLSNRLWQNGFAADPSIIGRSVPPGLTVVGVAAPDFDYPVGADLWIAFRPPPEQTGLYLDAVGRLAPGVTPAQARAELEAFSARFAEESSSFQARVMTLTDLKETIVGDTSTTLFVLFGAAAIFLLIACANVMNLLLVRGATRSGEIALRAALGAERQRLFRQLLTESLVLAGLGAAIGLGISWISLRVLETMGPADLPRMSEIAIDGQVLAFTVAATGFTGVVFGLLPTLQLLGTDLKTLMGGSTRGPRGGTRDSRIFNSLVLGQTALAVMLVIGASLLVRSYGRLRSVDPGFRTDSLLVMDANLPALNYPDYREVARMYEEYVDRVANIPGVVHAAATTSVPLGEQLDFMQTVRVQGLESMEEPERARYRQVTPGFFDAMGIELVQGRLLSPDDRIEVQGVAVVNETFLDRVLGDYPPLGQRIIWSSTATLSNPTNPIGYYEKGVYEIVGIVRDVRYESLATEPEPSVYFAHDQVPFRRMMVVARVRGRETTSVSADMRTAFREMDPTLPVELTTMEALLDTSVATERMATLLLLAFGFSAVVLAAVGIFGVISLSVERRLSEMAIRAALGAEPNSVLWISMARGVTFAGWGIVAGVAGAIIARRVMATQLYEVSATDPAVMIFAPLLLAVVAEVAAVVPSFKATRVNLSDTLRTE
jgi:putative ABC transport system permease protein